jgi:hypothetical protein
MLMTNHTSSFGSAADPAGSPSQALYECIQNYLLMDAISKRMQAHIDRLIAELESRPTGRALLEEARQDGRTS